MTDQPLYDVLAARGELGSDASPRVPSRQDGPVAMADPGFVEPSILTDTQTALTAARVLLGQVQEFWLMVSLLEVDPAVVYERTESGAYAPLGEDALRLVIVLAAGDQPLLHVDRCRWTIRTASDAALPAKRLTLTLRGCAAWRNPALIGLPEVDEIRAVTTRQSALLRLARA